MTFCRCNKRVRTESVCNKNLKRRLNRQHLIRFITWEFDKVDNWRCIDSDDRENLVDYALNGM